MLKKVIGGILKKLKQKEEAFEYINKEMSWWGVFVDEE